MSNLTCASHMVFRFYWSEGHIHPQYVQDYYEEFEGEDGPEKVCVATEDDFQDEIFAWFRDKPWECGVSTQGACPANLDFYVEVCVDYEYATQFERIEQEIIQFLIDDPDLEIAKQRHIRKYQEEIRRHQYNPAYAALNQAINKMMGCG